MYPGTVEMAETPPVISPMVEGGQGQLPALNTVVQLQIDASADKIDRD